MIRINETEFIDKQDEKESKLSNEQMLCGHLFDFFLMRMFTRPWLMFEDYLRNVFDPFAIDRLSFFFMSMSLIVGDKAQDTTKRRNPDNTSLIHHKSITYRQTPIVSFYYLFSLMNAEPSDNSI